MFHFKYEPVDIFIKPSKISFVLRLLYLYAFKVEHRDSFASRMHPFVYPVDVSIGLFLTI